MNAPLDLDRIYHAMGFRCPPFRITPDTSFFFPHSQYLAALGQLRYGAMSGGLTLLTGEVGLGKTLLCRYFMRQLADLGGFRTAYVFNPKQGHTELLASLYRDLTGNSPTSTSEGGLHDELYAALIRFAEAGERVALIIDEAHALPPDMLERLRLLTNLETEERKLVALMLFGQNELEETLAHGSMRALRQRITLWHRLRPFGWLETADYIQHRLNGARLDGNFSFSRPAMLAARHLSGGTPRRINLICDRALMLAFSMNRHHVDLPMLRRAAHEALGLA